MVSNKIEIAVYLGLIVLGFVLVAYSTPSNAETTYCNKIGDTVVCNTYGDGKVKSDYYNQYGDSVVKNNYDNKEDE
jgi:hypothetical protein